MSNRVLTGVLAAATVSLLAGGGIARAAGLGAGPAPGPPAPDPVASAQSGPVGWVTAPVLPPPAKPGSTRHDTVVTPAPPGGATANVLQVNPIDTCVSCTSAGAGAGKASAGAIAIRLLGNTIAGGRTDGGRNSGALLAVPASPLLTLAIADWATSASPGSSSSAHSRAALVDLAIGPHGSGGLITVAVLEAISDAGYQGPSSGGSGQNNGVDLNVGDGALVVVLLHSDATSANRGSAYVAGINGTRILSTEQTGQSGIPVAVPGVVGLILLQVNANGGAADASVGTANDLLGQSGQAAGVLTASAVGLPGTGVAGNATATAATPPSTPGLAAPNTGMALGIAGLVILPAGLALLLFALSQRRRDATG